MPSQLLEKAAKGDEIALIQITWMIQHQQLLPDDMLHLVNLQMNFDQSNVNEKYLVGLANYFGTTFFRINTEKAETIMSTLVTEDHFSYAKFALGVMKSDKNIIEEAALVDKNPLGQLDYALFKMKDFGYKLGQGRKIENNEKSINQIVLVELPPLNRTTYFPFATLKN